MDIRFSLVLLMTAVCGNFLFAGVDRQAQNSIEVPLGGNTYQTKGGNKEEVNADGILSWKNADSEFSVYFKSIVAKEINLTLELLPQEGAARILVSLNGQTHEVELKAGDSGLIDVGKLNLVFGYNEIKLQGLEKAGSDFANIKSLKISHEGELALDFVKDNIDNRFYWGRRGPSVHLSYTLPSEGNFKWFYNEMTVPTGEDPVGSYFMANGFGEGYFGIQVNSESERRILFSVWSPFATDKPGDIPEDQKIKLLKKGADVYTGEFGNEGSGGQSYLRYNWVAGNTYKFLNSVEPDGKGNTVYTAYFFAPELGEWMLIASFLRPKTDNWYKRPHSFLENFIPESGNLERRVFYDNQWMADSAGNWMELTEAKFTGDDIAKRGYRKDFAGGSDTGKFFLKNGGFFNDATELQSMHQRTGKGKVPQIDFGKLK
ncbi:DUF3472 domain-containing protein [Algoriphagus sp. A40]|uniref:DUF3472 domain-containing protein n=1 Tax=Algoriphagus sp. A40 TaxID=1945863 RepID=UPI0009859382|nr:DUF3472 domain-containing protein [Algoriphagus sp. A40]OOG76217.1 nematoblast specific protein [Algoriphagus sp. A40]